MSAVGVLDRDMSELIARNCPEAMPYAMRLAANADADGYVIDSRALAAAALGKSERTVSRWRAALQKIGFLVRYSGGNRGECVRMVIKRFASDASAFVAKRAIAAIWLRGKERRAALALAGRRKRNGPRCMEDPLPLAEVLGKGDMDVTRLTSIGGEAAADGLPADPRHTFLEGELLGVCTRCGLPEANARHRSRSKPRSTWSNSRSA